MKKQYNVISSYMGITHFKVVNENLTELEASRDPEEWAIYNEEEALEARLYTGWKLRPYDRI